MDSACEGTDSGGSTVRVSNLVRHIREDWWSDQTGGAIVCCKRIRNLARLVSNWEAAVGREGLRLVGVTSFDMESVAKTNWLSSIVATTLDGAVGLVVLSNCSATRAVLIMLMAFQLSSSSLVRPLVDMVAWDAQCWFGLSGGRREDAVGLVTTNVAS